MVRWGSGRNDEAGFNPLRIGGNLQVCAYELTMDKSGVLTLKNLPFNVGEKIEVIIIPRTKPKNDKKRYPFWGKPITYLNPTDPVAAADWEVYQ